MKGKTENNANKVTTKWALGEYVPMARAFANLKSQGEEMFALMLPRWSYQEHPLTETYFTGAVCILPFYLLTLFWCNPCFLLQ